MRKINVVFVFWMCCMVMFSQAGSMDYTVSKIWDDAPHSAFTDLIEYEDEFFCTFREGTGHIPAKDGTGDGKIRILVSSDGDRWESVALIVKNGFDLRDPKLSITPDGRLMVLIGASVYRNGQLLSRAPYVSFMDKNTKIFTEPQPIAMDPAIESDNNWLWRVTWCDSTGYGVVYQTSSKEDWTLYLVETSDAINYNVVTQLEVKGKPNEATVEILDKIKMRIIVRREEAGDNDGYLGYSGKDFTEWRWSNLGIPLGGPNIITLPNGKTIIGSRSFRENKAHMSLFGLDENGAAVELLELPSGNDTSYPGFIINNDELWVSYYSGHEGKTSIYLSKIKYMDL